MTFPHRISRLAQREIDERAIALAFRSGDAGLATRFYLGVDATVAQVASAPRARPLSYHRPVGDRTLRHAAVRGFGNDLLFYDFDGRTIVFRRLLHAAMDLPNRLRRP